MSKLGDKMSRVQKGKKRAYTPHPGMSKYLKNRKLSEDTKEKISNAHKRFWANLTDEERLEKIKSLQEKPRLTHKHHIYIVKESPAIILTPGQHHSLHQRAYNYILEKFGKPEIDLYIKWFKKKYMEDENVD